MAKILLLLLFTSPSIVFASKAKVTALGNANHLVDVQTIFTTPSNMTQMNDQMTVEFGQTVAQSSTSNGTSQAIDSTPNAEAGFITTAGNGKLGLYLGRQEEVLMDLEML